MRCRSPHVDPMLIFKPIGARRPYDRRIVRRAMRRRCKNYFMNEFIGEWMVRLVPPLVAVRRLLR